MKTNIENVTIFRDRGNYGYSILYKSGRHKTECTGGLLVIPDSVHLFMKASPYSIAHDENRLGYHEITYYARDIRNGQISR